MKALHQQISHIRGRNFKSLRAVIDKLACSLGKGKKVCIRNEDRRLSTFAVYFCVPHLLQLEKEDEDGKKHSHFPSQTVKATSHRPIKVLMYYFANM